MERPIWSVNQLDFLDQIMSCPVDLRFFKKKSWTSQSSNILIDGDGNEEVLWLQKAGVKM